jgi:iron complex outermembrane recepter protein
MRKQIALFCMVLFTMSAFAQFSIKGYVKDAADKNPLPGANLLIEDTSKGAHTGHNGSFNFSGLSEGNYTIIISYIGYTTQVIHLHVYRDIYVDVELERSPYLSEEVIVNATRADNRTPSTYTNVSKEMIQASNLGQDIPFLLSLTPSLIVSSDAGAGIGYTWMNIRGSDNSRINVTMNGIPLNDSESHGVWWVNMPDIASSTESIQIQRGVGTSTQGAASFGATISLQTNTLNDKPYAELFSSAGSFNSFRNTVSFGTGLLGSSLAFDGRISRITSDGYIDRSFSDLQSYYLSGGFYGKRTVVKAITFSGKEKTYQAWNGVPGNVLDTNRRFNPSGMFMDDQGNMQFYDNETDNYQQDHYQLHFSHEINPLFTANTSLHYTYGRGYYEQYRQNDRFSRYGLPDAQINSTPISRTDLIRQRWLDNHFYGFTYSLNYNSLSRINGVLGGGYNIYEGSHFGEIIWARISQGFDKGHRYYDNEARKGDLNSFIKLNYELSDGLFVFGDLQYRNIFYDFQGLGMVNNEVVTMDQRAEFNFLNPKAGVLYDNLSGHKAHVFFGVSNREPVRRDFTESSPESRPRHETLRNLEIGYNFAMKSSMLGINFFLMDYKDQLILTGEINDVGGFTRTNIDKSYRMGLEFEYAVRATNWLELAGNITWSQNKIPEFTEFSDVYDEDWNWTGTDIVTYKNTDIAFSPSVVSAGLLNLQPIENGKISLQAKYVSNQYIDNTMSSERMLDPYLVNDLKMSYLIRSGIFRELEINVAIYNIFDRDYITNAWIYKGILGDSGLTALEDGYFPQAGRHFLAGLRLKL